MQILVGQRPGHPIRATVVAAVALAGTLALAAFQVGTKRQLTDPVDLGPLSVRVPADFRQDADDPGSFLGPTSERLSQIGIDFVRVLRVRFVPAGGIMRPTNVRVQQATIGSLPAQQWRSITPQQTTAGILEIHTLHRVAALPRGEQIHLEYARLFDLAPSDLELFDRVARTVELMRHDLTSDASTALEQANLSGNLPNAWLTATSWHPAIPGLHVTAVDEAQLPRWIASIHRTWLGQDRSARDVLRSVALRHWSPDVELIFDTTQATADQRLHAVRPQRPNPVLPILALVESATGEAVLIEPRAVDPLAHESLPEQVRALAGLLRFEFSGATRVDGTVPRAGDRTRAYQGWQASLPSRDYLIGHDAAGPVATYAYWTPQGDSDRVTGLTGRTQSGDRVVAQWEITDAGRSVALTSETRRLHSLGHEVREAPWIFSSTPDGQYVFGQAAEAGRSRRGSASTRASLGESPQYAGRSRDFVPPPMIPALLKVFASQMSFDHPNAVEFASLDPDRGLPIRIRAHRVADEQPNLGARWLIRADSNPAGQILTVNDAGRVVALEGARRSLSRVSPETAEQRFPELRRLRAQRTAAATASDVPPVRDPASATPG